MIIRHASLSDPSVRAHEFAPRLNGSSSAAQSQGKDPPTDFQNLGVKPRLGL
jgi:hypothetical protein